MKVTLRTCVRKHGNTYRLQGMSLLQWQVVQELFVQPIRVRWEVMCAYTLRNKHEPREQEALLVAQHTVTNS